MNATEKLGGYTTLVVRIWRDDAGRVSGVVERVKTGEKAGFRGIENLGATAESLLSADIDGRRA